MRTLDDILERAKRLSAQDRRELVEKLASLTEEDVRPPAPPEGPYAAWLAAAGTVHSDFTDLSTDKYKHVAAAALDGHDG